MSIGEVPRQLADKLLGGYVAAFACLYPANAWLPLSGLMFASLGNGIGQGLSVVDFGLVFKVRERSDVFGFLVCAVEDAVDLTAVTASLVIDFDVTKIGVLGSQIKVQGAQLCSRIALGVINFGEMIAIDSREVCSGCHWSEGIALSCMGEC